MILRPPRTTRPDTLCPNTTRFRSALANTVCCHGGRVPATPALQRVLAMECATHRARIWQRVLPQLLTGAHDILESADERDTWFDYLKGRASKVLRVCATMHSDLHLF